MRVITAGDLKVCKDIVFRSYYYNPATIAEAFTFNSWFRTRDLVTIDINSNLYLMERTKDIININSVKFKTTDI